MVVPKGFSVSLVALVGLLMCLFIERMWALHEAFPASPSTQAPASERGTADSFVEPSGAFAPDSLDSQPQLDAYTAPDTATDAPDSAGWAYEKLDKRTADDSELEFYELHYEYMVYAVQAGDSLWSLERRFGVRFELIYAINKLELDRNFARRCGEGNFRLATTGHCSAPEATLQRGMVLQVPTRIWVRPLPSVEM